MVRKGVGPPPMPSLSGELSHVEFDLQIHRDKTTAKFSKMQESFKTMIAQQQSIQSIFRAEILEQLCQLRAGPKSIVTQSKTALQFGTLPTSSLIPTHSTAGETLSSSIAATDGTIQIFPRLILGSSLKEVIFGRNPTSTDAVMINKIMVTNEQMISSTVGALSMLNNEHVYHFHHTRLGNNRGNEVSQARAISFQSQNLG